MRLSFNLLAAMIGSCIAVPISDAVAERAACPDYALVIARGTGEVQGPSLGFKGVFTNGMTNQTFNAVPNGVEYDVVYPATAGILTSEKEGAADVVRYVTEQRVACPKQEYVLMGYSQGATVIILGVDGLKSTPLGLTDVAAVLTIGNPYQFAGQQSIADDIGTGSNRGDNGSLLGIFSSDIHFSDKLDKSGKLLQICYQKDLVCAGIKLGNLNANHFLYAANQRVQDMGAKHIIGRLRA